MPTGPRDKADPLADPVKSTLLFGGVFWAAVIVRLVQRFFSGNRLSQDESSDFWAVTLLSLFLAVGAGVPSALLRRTVLRGASSTAKNRATGILVGVTYGIGCDAFFGRELPWLWRLVLAFSAGLGMGYAVISGLNSVAPNE